MGYDTEDFKYHLTTEMGQSAAGISSSLVHTSVPLKRKVRATSWPERKDWEQG